MKNMKKNKNMRELRVVARGMVPLANGEAASCGEAALAQNVRERELSLQVTGEPVATGTIAVGDRLLLMADGHTVTCSGQTVKIDGAPVATVTGAVIGAHAIGGLIVVVAEGGLTYLAPGDGGGWSVLNVADAMPQLTIGERRATSSATIDAYTFASPYVQWRAPLADADRNALTSQLRAAWSALSADIAAEGRYMAPVLVRWAVRLQDGSYLWMSDPVMVGDDTLANADRIAARVTIADGKFAGAEATTLTLTHYGLDIGLTGGIGAAWLPLVAAIDVFVTDEPRLLTASRTLDYRCVTRTDGGREYLLEMRLSRRSDTAITRELAASPWHLVATASVAGTMPTGSDFGAADDVLTMTSAQCGAIGLLPSLAGVVCSTAAGGRLYCCTRGGDVVVSVPGNALAAAHRRSVLGAVPLSMAVVTRPLYSGGFGRYPVYIFTDDGIYAIPQSVAGTLGEARLVDRTVIAADVRPVEGGGDIWLMSRHGHLCRLVGARLEVCQRDVDCTAMAWCNAHEELWLLRRAGYPVVMMPSGRMSVRTVAAAQLYGDARHCVVVSPAGVLLDVEQEAAAVMPVAWRSHPIALHPLMGEAMHRVVWHVSGNDVELTLQVTGQRGIMAHDVAVGTMTVTGAVNHPLAAPTLAVQGRTVTLSLDGMAASGTLVLPTLLYGAMRNR